MEYFEKIKDVMKNTGIMLKDGSKEAIDNFIRKECNSAREKQKYSDIIIAVMALSDAGLKDDELYEPLSKFWGIDSRIEAKEYIEIGRHIEWPKKKLKSYLSKIGFSPMDVIRYFRENNVEDKLKNNSKLCELTDEKLKVAIER